MVERCRCVRSLQSGVAVGGYCQEMHRWKLDDAEVDALGVLPFVPIQTKDSNLVRIRLLFLGRLRGRVVRRGLAIVVSVLLRWLLQSP